MGDQHALVKWAGTKQAKGMHTYVKDLTRKYSTPNGFLHVPIDRVALRTTR